MRLYLDAVGGIAGDMFAAAVLDTWPELQPRLVDAFCAAGLDDLVRIDCQPYSDGVLTGSRFRVLQAPGQAHGQEAHHDTGHEHRHYRSIAGWLESAPLGDGARRRAADIFRLLASAEARVHGIPPEEVTFHEVGAWDSIADVVAAAWLIDAIGPARWHAASLPMGRGRVRTAHGELPLPAPATSLLLEGYPLHQDEAEGERITPTGAAILRHIAPSFEPLGETGRLRGGGYGFGTRRLAGRSNVLRILAFDDPVEGLETAPAGQHQERIAVCHFEIDDQPAEDLAVAIERLRHEPGVLDVLQAPVFGKKGRLATQVQLLASEDAVERAIQLVLRETSTLGVRRHLVDRTVLARESGTVAIGSETVRIKSARRPGGDTVKAELDDVAAGARDYRQREALRARARALAPGGAPGVEGSPAKSEPAT